MNLAQALLYRGAGLMVVWPELLELSAIGGVFFLLALALLRRNLETS